MIGASEWIQKQIREYKNNTEKLRAIVDDLAPDLPDTIEEGAISPQVLAEQLCGMSPTELREFISKNKRAFDNTNLPKFYALYAINRWIVVKNEKAIEESLDQMLAVNLDNPAGAWDQEWDSDIFSNLKEDLKEDSNRLGVALTILRQSSVKRHLTDHFGFNFSAEGPRTLTDVLYAHPVTASIFSQEPLSLNDEQQKAYDFLKAIGFIYEPHYRLPEALNDFRIANSLSRDLKRGRDRLKDDLKTITHPMNTARNLDDIHAGKILSLYELLKRDNKSAADIWKKVALEQEFRKRFPTDDLFWHSTQSLMEIYQMLETDRGQK